MQGKLPVAEKINVETGENVAYALPQKISVNADDTKIFFRVKNVVNDATVIISSGEKELVSVKRPALTPGEMQTVVLKKNNLINLSEGIEIKVVK